MHFKLAEPTFFSAEQGKGKSPSLQSLGLLQQPPPSPLQGLDESTHLLIQHNSNGSIGVASGAARQKSFESANLTGMIIIF